MGAGSSKEGLDKADDNISLGSDEEWGGPDGSKNKRSKSFDHPIPVHDNDTRESKSDIMFSFPRSKNTEDDDLLQANESSGFKIFKNRKKKTTHIDEDIDDIEKTFESLGIDKTFEDIDVDKTFAGTETLQTPPSYSVAKPAPENLSSPLEPMRNKSQDKVTNVGRGYNNNYRLNNNTQNASNSSQMLNNSYGRGRRFSFSWENQEIKPNGHVAPRNEDWSYNKVSCSCTQTVVFITVMGFISISYLIILSYLKLLKLFNLNLFI